MRVNSSPHGFDDVVIMYVMHDMGKQTKENHKGVIDTRPSWIPRNFLETGIKAMVCI